MQNTKFNWLLGYLSFSKDVMSGPELPDGLPNELKERGIYYKKGFTINYLFGIVYLY